MSKGAAVGGGGIGVVLIALIGYFVFGRQPAGRSPKWRATIKAAPAGRQGLKPHRGMKRACSSMSSAPTSMMPGAAPVAPDLLSPAQHYGTHVLWSE